MGCPATVDVWIRTWLEEIIPLNKFQLFKNLEMCVSEMVALFDSRRCQIF
jgi:hypothetical protein